MAKRKRDEVRNEGYEEQGWDSGRSVGQEGKTHGEEQERTKER